MRLLGLVLVIALSAACASQPTTPTAAATVAARPVAAAAPAAAETTGKVGAKAKVPSGFKAKTRDGETVYCKKVAQVGTRFETETCMTAAEAAELERKAESDRAQFRKNSTICGTGGCGGS